jgi:DNA end-binding protein Ku
MALLRKWRKIMATTIWKGHLTFGLISVPVKLFAAARSETVSFNQIHAPCGSRIKMQTFCPTCNRTVERKELQKGYEVEPSRYLIIEEADLEKMVPQSAKTLEVQSFVRLAEVDPVYFNTSYYMVADGAAGEKAYYLLVKALLQAGYAGIAKITMHQREHIVIVRPGLDGLMLHTLYYADEVRKVDEYGHPEKVVVNDKELELAQMFINALAAPFDAGQFRDRYRDNVMELIQAKAAGLEVKAPAPVPQAPIMDLMAALKASIEKSVPAAESGTAAPAPPAAAPVVPAPVAGTSASVAASPAPVGAAPAPVGAAPALAPVGAPPVPVAVAASPVPAPSVEAPAASPTASPARAPVAVLSATGGTVAASAAPASGAESTTGRRADPDGVSIGPAPTQAAEPAVSSAPRKKPPVRLTPAAETKTDAIAQ